MNVTWSRTWPRNLGIRYGTAAFLCILCLLLLLQLNSGPKTIGLKPELRELILNHTNIQIPKDGPSQYDIGIVMAKTGPENVNWLIELYHEMPFRPFIYSMKSPAESGCLTPRSRRGRETAPYLSYIIDNYDSLPDYSIFIHSKDEQWHNDILGTKSADTIKALRFEHINATGFVNLRCALNPGCPLGVNPLDPTEEDIRRKDTRAFFAEIYMELLDVTRDQVPRHIGNVCCAQFAVTRARILRRPKSDYETMLRWVENSHEVDFGIGWVFGKLWDTIFGMDAIKYVPRI